VRLVRRFSSNNKITVEAWLRPTTLSGNGSIIGSYANPGNEMQFFIKKRKF